jgi:hypothetical protein
MPINYQRALAAMAASFNGRRNKTTNRLRQLDAAIEKSAVPFDRETLFSDIGAGCRGR